MNAAYLNHVLNAFTNVLPQLGFTTVQKGNVSVNGRNIKSSGVCVVMGCTGDIKGTIIYDLNEESAKKIASKMMMGMPVDELNEMAQSAISELANMLTANAATDFSKDGLIVDISTPAIFTGDFVATANSEKVICIEMKADDVNINVNISIETNK